MPPTVKPLAISANGSSQSSGTVVFSNGHGVSFGMRGYTVTASVSPVPMPIVGVGGVSVFTQNGSVVISGPTLTNIVAGPGVGISTLGNSVYFFTN
jgi:hypothetical protein